MKRVLVLCTGNSCRSQMAEGIWKSCGWDAHSAGSKPSGHVHPMAIEAMGEIDIDISTHRSKSVSEFDGQMFDVAVTVCDNAREACPIFPGARAYLHWPFRDPVHGGIADFREVRDQIRERIRNYLSTGE